MTYRPVTHVLFDMDGLILNTEELYTIGFKEIASRYGKTFTFELKSKIMGQQSKEFAGSIIDALELPITVEEFLKETRIIFDKLFPDCKVMPGVKRLIHHLHDNNIPIGLATSSSKETYDMKVVKHQELFDLLTYKTWGTSDPLVNRGKPYPDIFLVAASKFHDNPAPERCLVFEDSLNGVEAARAAGMQVVMVPDPRLDRARASNATIVLDSVENFRPELFGYSRQQLDGDIQGCQIVRYSLSGQKYRYTRDAHKDRDISFVKSNGTRMSPIISALPGRHLYDDSQITICN